MHSTPTLDRFIELACGAEERVRLDEAALEIARIEYPTLNTSRWLARLNGLAGRTWDRRRSDDGEHLGLVGLLNRSLFGEEGFRGNADAYYEPQNSFLNDVLDRRLGIPITLSLVYMEVARRLGFTVEGIGFPGHFLVRARVDDRLLHVDPFHGGRLLTAADCQDRLDHAFGVGVELDPAFMEPVGPRHMLRRVLQNLKGVYVCRRRLDAALAVMERIVLLSPDDPVERRDRGKLRLAVGDARGAALDLEEYLGREPDADDRDEIKGLMHGIRRRQAQVN